MKINCKCGYLLVTDSTSVSSQRLLSTQAFEYFLDKVEQGITTSFDNDDSAYSYFMEAFSNLEVKEVWECPQCSRTYFFKTKGDLVCYAQE